MASSLDYRFACHEKERLNSDVSLSSNSWVDWSMTHSSLKADLSDTYDVIILGAGISGLVSASILINNGCKKVIIVDTYSKTGGNQIDVSIGSYTFDIGSFIFQDDSPLLKHFPDLLPLYIGIDPTWSRLNPQGKVTKYPVSLKHDLLLAGPLEWMRIILSVLYARLYHRDLKNAYDFARYWIGSRFLRRSGLENYMERFYGRAPKEIDIDFAKKRMLWIKEHASLRNPMLRRKAIKNDFPKNKQLARPREGFDYLYSAAVSTLRQSGVRFDLGVTINGLSKSAGAFRLSLADRTLVASRVISTLPLTQMYELCGLTNKPSLQSVTLISLFYSFDGKRGFTSSILYNFSYGGSWKRLTVYSDFYGRASNREFFAVEVNSHHVFGSVDMADQQFRTHTKLNRLFVGDLKLEGSHILHNAYPIYVHKAGDWAEKAIIELKEFGVESLGRQGLFDYQPTSRDSTVKAERALRGEN